MEENVEKQVLHIRRRIGELAVAEIGRMVCLFYTSVGESTGFGKETVAMQAAVFLERLLLALERGSGEALLPEFPSIAGKVAALDDKYRLAIRRSARLHLAIFRA